MPFEKAISDSLSLNSLQLTASSALASELVAYSQHPLEHSCLMLP
jgi:hypothetical protein